MSGRARREVAVEARPSVCLPFHSPRAVIVETSDREPFGELRGITDVVAVVVRDDDDERDGADSGCSASVLTRKRWPSAETSYTKPVAMPPVLGRVSNSARTAPTSTAGPCPFTAAAISLLSGAR